MRLSENTLNFALEFMVIVAIGNVSESRFLNPPIVFKYRSIKIHRSIERLTEEPEVFLLVWISIFFYKPSELSKPLCYAY